MKLKVILITLVVMSFFGVTVLADLDPGDNPGDIIDNPWGNLFTTAAPTEAPTETPTAEPTTEEPTTEEPTTEPEGYYNVQDYKSILPWEYPTIEDKIFAGWYTDETLSEVYYEDIGYGYGKFIDENILGPVKFQIANDGSAIRFISSVDCSDYQGAGFIISGSYDGHTITEKSRSAKKLYETIMAAEEKVKPTIFSPDSHYFFTYTVTGLNADKIADMTWDVTPYFVTPDGTTVTGAAGEYPVN